MKRLLLLTLGLATGCDSGGGVRQVSDAERIEAARAVAGEAFKRLSGELTAAVAEGGPPSAIEICSKRATEITGEIADREGVELVRLSDKPRNPDQLAADGDLVAIRSFRESLANGSDLQPRIEREASGAAVVRLPIVLSSPLCLQCHGRNDEIDGATRAAIAERYPDDLATGYSLNEVRGIWRVNFPAITEQ